MFFLNSLKQEKQLTLIMLLDQSKVNKIKLYRLLNTTSKSYKKSRRIIYVTEKESISYNAYLFL